MLASVRTLEPSWTMIWCFLLQSLQQIFSSWATEMTFIVTPFPRQPDPFCRWSPNRLNCQRMLCFASTSFRNCNIHWTVCQERLQELKVIEVEGAVYQALTKKMHNSRRPFSSRTVRETVMMIPTETSRSQMCTIIIITTVLYSAPSG